MKRKNLSLPFLSILPSFYHSQKQYKSIFLIFEYNVNIMIKQLTFSLFCDIMCFSTLCAKAKEVFSLSSTQRALIRDEMSQRIIDTAEDIATENGAHTVTVRKILQTLGITNRVFYNRFHNIDEVLATVYKSMIPKIRESITTKIDDSKDFFEQVTEVVVNALLMSYDTKMQFNAYVFENDSLSHSNYLWWTEEIKKLINYAKQRDYIKDVDPDILSYSIWCFCRGYNADAVGRRLPKSEAVKNFKYSFGFLLDGLKKKPIADSPQADPV